MRLIMIGFMGGTDKRVTNKVIKGDSHLFSPIFVTIFTGES
jgi:hypothetical protein